MNINEIVYIIAKENNVSLASIARSINQSPQNFNNKLKRGSLSLNEFEEILKKFDVDYSICLSINNKQLSYTNNHINSNKVLEFCIFCIEKLKSDLKISGKQAYRLLTCNTNVLYSYIVKCYDVLHTQDEKYIVNDLKEVLKLKGINIDG